MKRIENKWTFSETTMKHCLHFEGGGAPLNKVSGGPQPRTLPVTQACGRAHSWLLCELGNKGEFYAAEAPLSTAFL